MEAGSITPEEPVITPEPVAPAKSTSLKSGLIGAGVAAAAFAAMLGAHHLGKNSAADAPVAQTSADGIQFQEGSGYELPTPTSNNGTTAAQADIQLTSNGEHAAQIVKAGDNVTAITENLGGATLQFNEEGEGAITFTFNGEVPASEGLPTAPTTFVEPVVAFEDFE
jgi:hypothetical protein